MTDDAHIRRHGTDYDCLISFGFSPFKAAEISLDAKRFDPYALHAVRLAWDAAAFNDLPDTELRA